MGFFNQPFKRRVFVTQEKGQGLKKNASQPLSGFIARESSAYYSHLPPAPFKNFI